jgi:hypothetical protein
MRVSGERAFGGLTSEIMNLGDTVTWRVAAEITEYPRPFVEERLRGPFRQWFPRADM